MKSKIKFNMKVQEQWWQVFIKSSEISFKIAMPLIILTISGYFLDKKFQTKPILVLIGLGVSVVITFFILFTESKKVLK